MVHGVTKTRLKHNSKPKTSVPEPLPSRSVRHWDRRHSLASGFPGRNCSEVSHKATRAQRQPAVRGQRTPSPDSPVAAPCEKHVCWTEHARFLLKTTLSPGGSTVALPERKTNTVKLHVPWASGPDRHPAAGVSVGAGGCGWHPCAQLAWSSASLGVEKSLPP